MLNQNSSAILFWQITRLKDCIELAHKAVFEKQVEMNGGTSKISGYLMEAHNNFLAMFADDAEQLARIHRILPSPRNLSNRMKALFGEAKTNSKFFFFPHFFSIF
jgi:hypothetical protein